MSKESTTTAFAPASIGNLGVGFDMLGLAIEGIGDRVVAKRTGSPGVTIAEIRDPDGNPHSSLSTNAAENTASIAADSLWRARGDGSGLELVLQKGIPLQSGMGSSAASAVAAVFAANALLDEPLLPQELLPHALAGEAFASGDLHADNVAPSLLGGLVLCPRALLPGTISLPIPTGLCSVLLHPQLQVNTAESRKGLATNYSMQQWLTQQGYLAGFVAACAADDVDLLRRCLRDELIEPQRAASVPCFRTVQDAALQSSALGCSLSGSGPSIFSVCHEKDATAVAAAMEEACRSMGYECRSWISPFDSPGARLE